MADEYYKEADAFIARLADAELAAVLRKGRTIDDLTDSDLRVLKSHGYPCTRAELEALEAQLPPPPPRFMGTTDRRQNDLDSLIHADPNPPSSDREFMASLGRMFSQWQSALREITDAGFWKGMQTELQVLDGRITARLQDKASGVRPIANTDDEDESTVPNAHSGWMSRRS